MPPTLNKHRSEGGRFSLILLLLALFLPLLTHAATNETLYQTGFEPPTFTPDQPASGQGNWGVFRGPDALSISTNNPHSGTQCLQIDGACLERTGTNSGRAYYYSTVLLDHPSPTPAPIVELTAWVRLDGPQTGTNGAPADEKMSANFIANGNADGQNVYLGEMVVSSAGRIFTVGTRTEDNYKFVAPMSFGAYHKLVMRVDFLARTLRYFVDGTHLGVVPFAANVQVDRIAFAGLAMAGPLTPFSTPYEYNPSNYTAYFDDYSVVSIPLSPVNAVVEFTSTNTLADEFMPTARLTLVRRGSLNAAVRVTIRTTNETAIAGEDYEPISTSVTFAVGETNKTIEIPLHDDYWAEPDKTFTAHITEVLPTGITSPIRATRVFIRDDERPGSFDSSWFASLGESLGTREFILPDTIESQPNGKILVRYEVYNDPQFNGPPVRSRTRRLNPDGSLDLSFMLPAPGWNEANRYSAADGKQYIVEYNSQTGESRLTQRTNPDGTKDETFRGSVTWTGIGGFFPSVDIAPLPDNKLLVISDARSTRVLLNGQRIPSLSRLSAEGTLDLTFVAPTNAFFLEVYPLTNGQFLARSLSDQRPSVERLFRLTVDGSMDPNFQTGFGPTNGFIRIDRIQTDGKIVLSLLAAVHTTFNGKPHSEAIRLHPNGSVDSNYFGNSLIADTPGNNAVLGPRLELRDGRTIVAGHFRGFNGRIFNSIARLNPDESVDETFRSGQGFQDSRWRPGDPGYIDHLYALDDGRILVTGIFQQYDRAPVCSPLVLNADGSRDINFAVSQVEVPWDTSFIGAYELLFPIHDQFYIATGFGIGRLNMNLRPRIVSTTRNTSGLTHFTANALADHRYTLQSSESLTNWTDLITQTATTNRIDFTDAPTNAPARRFYRVKQD